MQYTLRELRARKNKTQNQVAQDLGISTQTYNAWEKDISNVAVSKVVRVADYFGVSIGDIFLPNNMNNFMFSGHNNKLTRERTPT